MPSPHRRPWLPPVIVLGLVCGGCSSRFGAPDPATRQGDEVLGLWRVLMLTGVGGGGRRRRPLTVTVVRDRRRGSQAPGLPPQTRENIPLEIAYTAVPLVIVAVLFALTLRAQRPGHPAGGQPRPAGGGHRLPVGVALRLPGPGRDRPGRLQHPPTLVLPLGVTTRLVLASPDVIHSFSVPAFLVKKDVVPGTTNELDVTPTRVGRFAGYCAEFCGLDHARMTFDVEVLDPARVPTVAGRAAAGQERAGRPGTATPARPGRPQRPGPRRPGRRCPASEAAAVTVVRGPPAAAAADGPAPTRASGPGRLGDHHRPQADRRLLHGLRLRLLPAGRGAGPAHAGRAGPAGPGPGVGRRPTTSSSPCTAAS